MIVSQRLHFLLAHPAPLLSPIRVIEDHQKR